MRVLPGAAGPSACALQCKDACFLARVLFNWWCCGLLHGVLKPLCMQHLLLAESRGLRPVMGARQHGSWASVWVCIEELSVCLWVDRPL
jgi:hypothetical protein